MSCAEIIKKVRNQLHLDQKQFADELGLTKTAIYNYEIGLRKPKLSIIKRMKDLAIANDIDLSIDDFLN